MSAVIISILVVLVIIIVVAAAAWTLRSSQDDKSTKKVAWHQFNNTNFIQHGGPPGPRMSRPDGRVTFAGDTDSVSQCQDWCEKDPDCLGYTHVGNVGTDWANQCYLLKGYDLEVASRKDHQSGWKYYA